MDYIFRWMAIKLLPDSVSSKYVTKANFNNDDDGTDDVINSVADDVTLADDVKSFSGESDNETTNSTTGTKMTFDNQSDAPPCPDCGEIMVRNGACYKCMYCGSTSGCS